MQSSIVRLLIVSLLLGTMSWSIDIHAEAPIGQHAQTSQDAGEWPDNDYDNSCSDHCGHSSAHITGLPATAGTAGYRPGDPDWLLARIAHHSLTLAPPTPPPNR